MDAKERLEIKLKVDSDGNVDCMVGGVEHAAVIVRTERAFLYIRISNLYRDNRGYYTPDLFWNELFRVPLETFEDDHVTFYALSGIGAYFRRLQDRDRKVIARAIPPQCTLLDMKQYQTHEIADQLELFSDDISLTASP